MNERKLLREVYYAHDRMLAAGVGQSKFELKKQARRDGYGKRWWVYFDKKIFSTATRAKYLAANRRFVRFCGERFGIAATADITPRMMKAYVREKEGVLKPNALRGAMAAIAKFGEWLGQAHAFHRVSAKVGKGLPKQKPRRLTYGTLEIALAIVQEIERVDARRGLAARFCLESGCRLIELARLRQADLVGVTTIDGRPVGMVRLTGKGGKRRDVDISVKTFEALQAAFAERVVLVKYHGFRQAYARAVEAVLGRRGGPHEMRRFSIRQFFKEGYQELRERGLTSWEASALMYKESAERLGHVRPGITKIYKRG